MKSKMIRNIAIFVGIFILVVVGYSVFFKKSAPTSPLESTGVAPQDLQGLNETQTVGQEFLTTLLNIQNIKLDFSIFDTPTFSSLVDFSQMLTPDPNPGRPNPFAPLGIDPITQAVNPVTTNPTSAVAATSATLNASIVLSGGSATRWFEYGTTASLGSKTLVVSQSASGNFTQLLTGLTPGTTYYAKAVTQIGTTISSGVTVTFTTLAQ